MYLMFCWDDSIIPKFNIKKSLKSTHLDVIYKPTDSLYVFKRYLYTRFEKNRVLLTPLNLNLIYSVCYMYG